MCKFALHAIPALIRALLRYMAPLRLASVTVRLKAISACIEALYLDLSSECLACRPGAGVASTLDSACKKSRAAPRQSCS
ncbi:hypothetical protein PYCCODRAFT_1288722 [Trametes coccinea BRFM310]|uniref:Uncharacterized protein n=1 Tax=Trametes coccinea (strain BRFM310) TaxID=1353009 RepID=A0A1Y2IVJ1_TRAC3|nr:hypothetical protein PYCCODRAFT_1288722 [Trametes coccinea BRFM310]